MFLRFCVRTKQLNEFKQTIFNDWFFKLSYHSKLFLPGKLRRNYWPIILANLESLVHGYDLSRLSSQLLLYLTGNRLKKATKMLVEAQPDMPYFWMVSIWFKPITKPPQQSFDFSTPLNLFLDFYSLLIRAGCLILCIMMAPSPRHPSYTTPYFITTTLLSLSWLKKKMITSSEQVLREEIFVRPADRHTDVHMSIHNIISVAFVA